MNSLLVNLRQYGVIVALLAKRKKDLYLIKKIYFWIAKPNSKSQNHILKQKIILFFKI